MDAALLVLTTFRFVLHVDPITPAATVVVLAQAGGAEQSLLNQGAVGAIALIALGAVGYLFRLVLKSLAAATARADKWEAKYEEINELFRDRYAPALTEAMAAISQMTRVLEEGRERGGDAPSSSSRSRR